MAYELEIGSTRSRAPGCGVPLRTAGPPFERNSPRGSSYLFVCGLPPGNRDAPSDYRLLCLLANRCAPAARVAVGAPCAANRRGDGQGAGLTTVTTTG